MDLNSYASHYLKEQEASSLLRTILPLESANTRHLVINGVEYTNFCSNDYWGLKDDLRLAEKGSLFAKKYGTGAGASPLICGHHEPHRMLEDAIAKDCNQESAMLFSSGYVANLGVLSNLMKKEDFILFDKLSHASIIDGAKLSEAKFRSYTHLSEQDLLKKLDLKRKEFRHVLVVSDSVFSMDGDIANIRNLQNICREYDAWLYTDHAHSSLPEPFEPLPDRHLVMGTFSKMLGAQGAYVCGNKSNIEMLRNMCRSYVYSTSISPFLCGAILEALRISQEEKLAEKLQKKCQIFQELSGLKSSSSIFYLLTKTPANTFKTLRKFKEQGIYVQAIRPPTVANNACRLRMTITLKHTEQELQKLSNAIKNISLDKDF